MFFPFEKKRKFPLWKVVEDCIIDIKANNDIEEIIHRDFIVIFSTRQ